MKKILSILMAISLILTSAIPAFADDSATSKGLERAILQVKSITAIPSDYKAFQYSSNTYEENGKNISVWYLNWNKDDYSGGISATAEDGGYLINFNTYSNKPKEGLGAISREAGLKKAEAFLTMVRPDIASKLRLMPSTNYNNGDRHYFNFKPYINDAIVSYVDVNVEVDRYTGDVIGYNFTGSSEDLSKLPDASGVIGLETAQKAYLDKIKISLSYYSHYDYNKRILTVFPAYSGANREGKAIDAKTGEPVDLYNDYIYYGGMGDNGAMKTASSNASDSQLTQEELNAITGLSALITKEKAESVLRSTIPGLTSNEKVLNTSLTKNYIEKDKYQWEIGFDGAYGVVNAKTGEVTSYYIYSEDSRSGHAALTEEKARAKAEAFIKKMAPEKFEQSRFYESPYVRLYRLESSGVTDYSFNYHRQVNGVDFIGNGFTVIVNKDSGMVTNYDCTWYDNVTFPSIEKVISQEDAFKAINATGKMGLMYKKVKADEAVLVYDFTVPANDYLIDPVNGVKLGYDGKAYKETALPEYSDIKGHWAETKILKLLENGYYLQGEKFNPNQKINQLDFLRYLYSPIQMYYDDDSFYDMMINDKIIKKVEKAPKAVMTRQDAAKFIVRYLGQSKAAEHPEIFINPFKDKVSDAYKGYAAICYGLKVMQGDKNGRFNGTNQVSNAEAAVMIYNALQVK